jgi:hypothetical protein
VAQLGRVLDWGLERAKRCATRRICRSPASETAKVKRCSFGLIPASTKGRRSVSGYDHPLRLTRPGQRLRRISLKNEPTPGDLTAMEVACQRCPLLFAQARLTYLTVVDERRPRTELTRKVVSLGEPPKAYSPSLSVRVLSKQSRLAQASEYGFHYFRTGCRNPYMGSSLSNPTSVERRRVAKRWLPAFLDFIRERCVLLWTGYR